jgi:hypothetical protein
MSNECSKPNVAKTMGVASFTKPNRVSALPNPTDHPLCVFSFGLTAGFTARAMPPRGQLTVCRQNGRGLWLLRD